ncbi:MAG: acyl-CoA carboxylase subunit beta [Chloroflexi bacterium]|nr:MAG: acyl-CoA carboxylase subunit beta [Chloroflexota bacterium]MBL1196684.1 acyl-CoA carboxylase subunit beta [Chloroflexota bacterium]NOH13977.1 acyl-CoA carboxylase subunit beta [Chloroflexota bacterium]
MTLPEKKDTAGTGPIDKNKDLKSRRQKLLEGGGEQRVKAQHAKGKMTARERIDQLLDRGSFQEIDPYWTHRHSDFGMAEKQHAGDSVVAGFGKIDGRMVCVYAQDFTVLGGSFSEVQGQKVAKLLDLAMENGVPVIGLMDSVGARIQEGVYSLAAFAELFWRNTQASGVIPQISVMLGPCAGGSVYSPGLTDFVVMTEGTSHMFLTGPKVIETVTGEQVDLDSLGGAQVHNAISGVAHFNATDESQALDITRTLLSYIPANNAEQAPLHTPEDDPWRMDETLNDLVPGDSREPYDMHVIIKSVFDLGSFFPVHAHYAQNVIVGFARLHGQSVGVVATQPMVKAGVLDIDSSDKISRFIRFCDAFGIPLITLVDTPGFLPGVKEEHGGIIRHGAKIVYAYSEATVPKLSVITRKAYGGAYIVMGSKYTRTDLVFAWPTAEVAVMGAEGAVNILYQKQLREEDDPQAAHARLVDEFNQKFANPFTSAASGHVDDVLLPSETRPRLIAALELLRDKRVETPAKKHGNMPV